MQQLASSTGPVDAKNKRAFAALVHEDAGKLLTEVDRFFHCNGWATLLMNETALYVRRRTQPQLDSLVPAVLQKHADDTKKAASQLCATHNDGLARRGLTAKATATLLPTNPRPPVSYTAANAAKNRMLAQRSALEVVESSLDLE